MQFEELDLNYDILDALDDMNFVECTPIQEHTIPPLLEGRDLIGVAQTGTGKTAAYLLPVLSKLRDGGYPKDAINCVIMAPTRELAQQIDQAMQGFAYYLDGISSVAVYGGNDGVRYEQEKRGMQMGTDVVIATPGRFISHLSLGNIDLSHVGFFILDEADRMLDMGFSDDIMQIVKYLPEKRQTIMFSATMPQKIIDLAKTILTNPVEVKLAVSKPAEKIQQSAFICYEPQKLRLIEYLFKNPQLTIFKGGDMNDETETDCDAEKEITAQAEATQEAKEAEATQEGKEAEATQEGKEAEALNRVIIFVGKKTHVKDVTYTLKRRGFNAEAMHSDLSQQERDDVMWRFKTGKVAVLVATDIVARGIDIDDVQLVINFDVPHDCEDYVHRIGRTARANHDGIAITLVNEKDQPLFKDIERFLEKEITKNPIPEELGEGPEYTGRASGKNEHKGGHHRRGHGKQKRFSKKKNKGQKPKAKS